MRCRALFFALMFLVTARTAIAEESSFFLDRVAPILRGRCLACHNAAEASGEFAIHSAKALLAGGASGEVVRPGNPDASYLLQLITPLNGAAEMPKQADPLNEHEVGIVRTWIADGAKWPKDFVLEEEQVTDADWWSLKPIVRGEIPVLDAADEPKAATPIDSFVIRKLREHGLEMSPAADRRTLIRRLYYDLIGLPPTPKELSDWCERLLSHGNESAYDEKAYADLVDELLASPRYGERWARHWLDVVHYGDTHGYDKDKLRPNAWPYRDYVIRAFNEDRCYSSFIKEQVAGDVLYPEQPQLIAATGFLVAGPWDFIGHVEVPASKMDGRVARNLDRDDMVTNTIQTFTSVTVQCARCHNHKFDPISQQDYYSLQSVFAAIGRHDRPMVTDPAVASKLKSLDAEHEQLVARKTRLSSHSDRETAANATHSKHNKANLAEIDSRLLQLSETREELLKSQPHVFAAATHFRPEGNHLPSKGIPVPISVLNRGMIDQPTRQVFPGTFKVSGELPHRFALPEGHPEGDRRIALAEWIADHGNPLTWRTIVNRVWLYHFGRGIVNSPNDFGRMGQQPTHPELLDWLATQFRDGGEWIQQAQSLKQLHRLIVTSNVYRQSSSTNQTYEEIDGRNQYYWRATRRRLEAEAVRDAVLHAAGKLDLKMYGPGFRDFVLEQTAHSPQFNYEKYDPNDPKTHRRSIYRFLPRSQPQPFMQTLDCADPSQQVAKRDETVTALGALAMLNNKLMVYMAEQMAQRLTETHMQAGDQVDLAFESALSRRPSDEERRGLLEHADEHGLASMCRVILNLNEFIFVD